MLLSPWNQKYYDRYVSEAQRLGVTPQYNQEQFTAKLDPSNYEGSYSTIYKNDLVTAARNQYNTAAQAYAKANGTAYVPYSGATDVDSLSTAYQNLQSQATYANDNATPKYDASKDPLYQQVQKEMQGITASGQPTFTAPDQASQDKYITDWQTKLTSLNQPTSDYYLGKLNKQVSDTYAANNPYSVGSGQEVKATQDATNSYLMNLVSQQNAQALALGQGQYQQDYNTAWNTYQSNLSQYNLANQTLGNLSNISTQQNQQDYLNQQNNAYQLQNTALQQQYAGAQQQQQQQWAQSMAQNYKQQSPDFWQSLLTPAMSAAGYAIGGPIGGIVGSGVSNLFGSSSGQTPSYNPMNYSNPYASQVALNANGYGMSAYQSNPQGYYSYRQGS